MQTRFTAEQLADPEIAEANDILRSCVHCGFCTATCPTYLLRGDELDSPRGRIYLIKEMLESGGEANSAVAKHMDRCLTCLSCMTTCPSGVDYMHLADIARKRIAASHRRGIVDRAQRALLARVLPQPAWLKPAMALARVARPLRSIAAAVPGMAGIAAMLALAPGTASSRRSPASGVHAAIGKRRARVALLTGCVQPAMGPEINAATVALLARMGVEVVIAKTAGCCGAVNLHMGDEAVAARWAKRNIDAWLEEDKEDGLDAIIVNTSGCGTTVKDYGHLLKADGEYRDRAARVAGLARDISEFLIDMDYRPAPGFSPGVRVAYHAACSLQHGQKISEAPRQLLRRAGFEVEDIAEGHICCGSAGTYSILQPQLAGELRQRKAAHINATGVDVVAAGNIGCMLHLRDSLARPIMHTVELLDWAAGGERPALLE